MSIMICPFEFTGPHIEDIIWAGYGGHYAGGGRIAKIREIVQQPLNWQLHQRAGISLHHIRNIFVHQAAIVGEAVRCHQRKSVLADLPLGRAITQGLSPSYSFDAGDAPLQNIQFGFLVQFSGGLMHITVMSYLMPSTRYLLYHILMGIDHISRYIKASLYIVII